MPLALSILKSRSAIYSPTSPRRKLYFPPGGHTKDDRHSIPPDQLCISFSDPVLVAAERELRELNVSNVQTRGGVESILKHVSRTQSTNKTKIRALKRVPMLRLPVAYGFVSRGPTNLPRSEPWSRSRPRTVTPDKALRRIRKDTCSTAAIRKPSLSDPSGSSESSPVSGTITIIDTTSTPGSSVNSTSGKGYSRFGPNLAPLASETFKEELYIRGYLKRPTIRPSNVTSHKSRTNLVFVNHGVFPQVVGRRHGQKITVQMRAQQDASKVPTSGVDTSLSEKQPSSTYFSCVTLPTPRGGGGGIDSPGSNANTTASESLDLHEFSYMTAFTTPPSSPSIVHDAEITDKGA